MKESLIKIFFSILSAIALGFSFWICLSLYRDYKHIKAQQIEFDSMQVRVNKMNAIIDSLTKREAVIIEQHNHNTKKYYENYYTIIAANDSATKNSLFSNLERYSYLHNLPPSKNNKPHN